MKVGRKEFGATIAIYVCAVSHTKKSEETKMAKSAKKGKLSGKKLEKKAPLSRLRG